MNHIKATIPLIMLACCGSAYAERLDVSTAVNLAAFYDDQFDLRLAETEVEAIVYSPEMVFSYAGTRNESTLSFGAEYTEYLVDLYEDDNNFSVSWNHVRNSKNYSMELQTAYDEQIVGNLIQVNDGVSLTIDQKIETFSFAPQISIDLSSLSNIQVLYSYDQNLTGNQGVRNKTDNHTAEFGYTRILSPRSSVSLFAQYLGFRPDVTGTAVFDSDRYGLAIGGSHTATSRWSIEGIVGAGKLVIDEELQNLSAEEGTIVDDGDVVYSAALSTRYSGRKSTVSATFIAGTTQQLDGVIDEQQQWRIAWNRQLSNNVDATFSADHLAAKRDDRKGYTLSSTINWRQSSNVEYRLAYRLNDQSAGPTAEQFVGNSNRITLDVTYSFDAMRFNI